VQDTKIIQVTSSQALPILFVSSDLPFLKCDVLSQRDGVGNMSVTMDTNFSFVDNKTVSGNIIVKYGEEEYLHFRVPVSISPPKCCRIIVGEKQLNYSKRNQTPISRRIAVLANGQLLPSDLIFHAVPEWLEIAEVEHDGQYAYVRLKYITDKLPSSWQGELFEVSALGHFASTACRGVLYRED
jgi:hypothetical protein